LTRVRLSLVSREASALQRTLRFILEFFDRLIVGDAASLTRDPFCIFLKEFLVFRRLLQTHIN